MKNWLEKIRNKSEVEKRSFAIFCSLSITVLIAAVYFFSMIAQNNFKKENVASPTSSLIEMFKGVIDNNKF